MKESKECAKPPKPPKPNMKNKEFTKWSKAESCKREDSIVSTEWHETLKRTQPFVPAYDNKPLNMVYLLSGEYGRIWQKERDEWYSKVFVPLPREKDMRERRAKIRREAREAKKAAEKSIRERKERKAKEAEEKAKAEAEKAEKLKAKLKKNAPPKKPNKSSKKRDAKAPEEQQENPSIYQEGWVPMELTVQCQCSAHKQEREAMRRARERDGTSARLERIEEYPEEEEDSIRNDSHESCTACGPFIKQIKGIQDKMAKDRLHKDEMRADPEGEE